MINLQDLVRENIWSLAPYSSARNEYSGKVATVFLDANENPYNKPYNRYPDPLQTQLKEKIAKVKNVEPSQIFLGNGSDEAIDLTYRIFCRPGIDNVVAIEPTYGMYKVCADINDIEYRPVVLDEKFQMSAEKLLQACDSNTKVIWICSPNNPTGNDIDRKEMMKVVEQFNGIVVIDEAYGDFSKQIPMRREISTHNNIIVLNTFSKAWGMAAVRLGMAFAQKEIIDLFNKVKYPYNINLLTQEKAIQALDNPYDVDRWISILNTEKTRLMEAVKLLPITQQVYPSDANFFLVKLDNAQAIYDYLIDKGIVVRNRSKITLCGNCLRITIGTKNENMELLAALRQY